MSSGFCAAGHQVVFAGENWARARLVYDLNFDHVATAIDLSKIVSAAALIGRADADVIVGGPPCQDFSAAGLRTEADRADLTWNFAEIVRACRPTWFVMENVPEAGTSRAWAVARARLTGAGYGLTEALLDASLYGVPQLRKRRFLIGRLGEDDQFLADYLTDWRTDQPLTIRGYLGDELGIQHYYRHPRHWGRRAIYSIDEPAATIRSTNRPIPPKYKSHPLDSAPVKDAQLLTPIQRARLQTFSSKFQFDRDLFQHEIDLMVANAVPVRLAECVGSAIGDFEERRSVQPSKETFRVWLCEQRYYTERSAGNVLSRLKRARRIIGREHNFSDFRDEVHALQKAPEFRALTTSVRSQLKKAVLLHGEFQRRS